MIKGIPNQPIDFVGGDLILNRADVVSPLLIGGSDDVIFQFIVERCPDAEGLFEDANFRVGWEYSGDWNFELNLCSPNGQADAYVRNTTLSVVIGEVYEVEVNATSVGGAGVIVSIGGVLTSIQSPGSHVFMVRAVTNEPFTIRLMDDTSSVCLDYAQVYMGNDDVDVEFVTDENEVTYTTSMASNPEYFEIAGNTVTVIIPAGGTGSKCFKIHLVDRCSPYEPMELCSQSITISDDCINTTKLRVCNDHDQPEMGFVAGRFEMRLPAIVILPTFQYENSEERLADGRINRNRISRQEALEMRVTDPHMGYSAHKFLSALPLFDHLYVEGREYVASADEYRPSYPSSTSSTGAVRILLRPKVDLFNKVQCEPEGWGCDPQFDPICKLPDIQFVRSVVSGKYMFKVTIASMVGFPVDSFAYTVNGIAQTPIPVSGSSMVFDIGPFTAGSVVDVTAHNAVDEACSWSTRLDVPCNCAPRSFVSMSVIMNGTPPLNEAFAEADGMAAVRDGCESDKPAWRVNADSPNGGLYVRNDGSNWTILDSLGDGFISADNPSRPCSVSRWFRYVDGVVGDLSAVRVCGGGDDECEGPCEEPGHMTIAFTDGVFAMVIPYEDPESGYFSYRRQSDDSVHTLPYNYEPWLIEGDDTICVWPSDAEGTPLTGALQYVGFIGGVTSASIEHLADIPLVDGVLQMEGVAFEEYVLPEIDGLRIFYLLGDDLHTLTLPASHGLIELVVGDALTEAAVNAILANFRANGFNGACRLDNGSNAAPTGQGLVDKAWLIDNGADVTTY